MDTRLFLFNYEFFDEYRAFGNGQISNILVSVEDIDQTTAIAASIDELFANSRNETLTSTEKEYLLSFARQLGDIGLIVNAILLAVFFSILSLTANTMSQAIRDRIPELAILKTLGFRDMTVLRVVLAESILITSVGYVGGMGFAALCLTLAERFVPAIVQLGSLGVSFETCITGFAVAVGMGILVGLPPAVQAKRVNIIDALRSN